MQGGARLGWGIAALLAAGVLVFYLTGGHSEGWFLRAARENAVRCLTKAPCTRMTARGVIVPAAPPLSAASRCARPDAWKPVRAVAGVRTRIVLRCSDGQAYLYHMGTLPGRNAGNAQWMACAQPSCGGEVKRLSGRTAP
jgi:hypothetical protein